MTIGEILQISIFGALLFVPFVTIIKVRKHLIGLRGYVLAVLVSSFVMSGVVITQWLSYDWYLDSKIAPLDRNGDGIWSNSETATWTEEDYKNMDAYIGDGGRNVFAGIIFPIFSVVYSSIVVVVYGFVVAIRARRKNA